MNDFTFDANPWDLALEELEDGSVVDAVRLLTLVEDASEEETEDVMLELEERHITLDIRNLPKPSGNGQAAVRLRREEELVKNGTLMTALEENEPLRLYMEEVAATPAFGDEDLLALQLAEGKRSVMEQLTNLGLGRVFELAKEYVGCGVLLLDLIQEGSLGLWQAIGTFDGGDYGAHRDWWIRQHLAKAVTMQARASGLGYKMRQALEDYRAVDERLLGDLGRNATVEEIAEELHMSVEETMAVARMLDNARRVHRAKAEVEPPEETEDDERHVEDTALFQMRQRILDLLSSLSKEDAKLLTLRFGLEGGKPLTPAEVGRKMGLTPEEVVAREAAALAQLRSN